MKRSFNYTGKHKLEAGEFVVVNTDLDGNNVAEVSLNLSDSTKKFLSTVPTAKCILRAKMSNASIMHSEYIGTCSKLIATSNLKVIYPSLQNSNSARYMFRFLVVESSGKILLEHVPSSSNENNGDAELDGLLPVRPRDLGQLLWKLEFSADEQPFLLYNKKLFELKNSLGRDPKVFAMLIPEILQQIIRWYLFSDDDEIIGNKHYQNWKSFCEQLQGEKIDIPEEYFEREQWLEGLISQFCQIHKFTDLYTQSIRGE